MLPSVLPPKAVAQNPQDVVARVRAEYIELPTLRLTEAQLQRLFNLDDTTCAAVLEDLCASGFLCKDKFLRYGRLWSFPVSEPAEIR